jgi:hypothetical protein
VIEENIDAIVGVCTNEGDLQLLEPENKVSKVQ